MTRLGLLWATGCVVLMSGLAWGQETAPSPKVEVRGVRVVAEGYGPNKDQARAFNWNKGTTLGLLVTMPDALIIDVEEEKSAVKGMKDDKGTDLLVLDDPDDPLPDGPVGPFVFLSEDSKAVMVEITGEQIPTAGATRIDAEGVLVLTCATRKEVYTQRNVMLRAGNRFSVGPVAFEITYTGEPEPDAAPYWPTIAAPPAGRWEVRMKYANAHPNLADIDIRNDADADFHAELDATGLPEDGFVSRTLVFSKQAETADISVSYWTERKEVKVPFNVVATLGLE